MPLTMEDVKSFVDAHPGLTFYTRGQHKPFTVTATSSGFTYTLSSGKLYSQPKGDMQNLLEQYEVTHSLTPSDYHHPNRHGSRFSSYFAGLMTVITNDADQEG